MSSQLLVACDVARIRLSVEQQPETLCSATEGAGWCSVYADGFPFLWCSCWGLYVLTRDEIVVYVGITKNHPTHRASYHMKSGKVFEDMVLLHLGKCGTEARYAESYLMKQFCAVYNLERQVYTPVYPWQADAAKKYGIYVESGVPCYLAA